MDRLAVGISCIDMFCGVGGLTAGLLKSGVNVVAGIDVDLNCRFAYETNNDAQFLDVDVSSLKAATLNSMYPKRDLRLLAGCAPCQPFSTYSQGRDTTQDQKWGLLFSFGRLIKESAPDFVTMENVPQLRRHKVFDAFLESLDGYQVWHDVVDCQDYGIPQRRKRLVLLASKHGPISLIPPTHPGKKQRTVADAIADLPKLRAGEASPKDPLHAAASLSPLNLKRIKQSRPGGTWRDWDSDLVADCHKKPSGETYPGVYGRMEWDKPAPTMTTLCYGFGNGRFGHPTQNRAISLREAAIFQTFPKSYKFVPKGQTVNFKSVGRMIGNAVPVRLGEVIGRSFQAHLQDLKL